ncbi:hypothetical protein ACVXHB_20885 [Escherichia coli]
MTKKIGFDHSQGSGLSTGTRAFQRRYTAGEADSLREIPPVASATANAP